MDKTETQKHDEYCEKLPHRNLHPQDFCQCRERTLCAELAAANERIAALTAQQAGEPVAVFSKHKGKETLLAVRKWADSLPDNYLCELYTAPPAPTQEFKRGMLRAAEICKELTHEHKHKLRMAVVDQYEGTATECAAAITRAAEQVIAECPSCGSRNPKHHPATSVGGEVSLCHNSWHKPTATEIRAAEQVNAEGRQSITFVQWCKKYHLAENQTSRSAWNDALLGQPIIGASAPHAPADWINAIAEEGTKAEAVRYLQETWNELENVREGARKIWDELVRTRERAEKLQSHCDRLTGMKFSDRMHAALVSRTTAAEAELRAVREDARRYCDKWEHGCDALCTGIALWIHRCPHCGMPAPSALASTATGESHDGGREG